jgi:hypothetical protein
MEPVALPKAIAPVTRSDRVKRAHPREDSGGGGAFARYLKQKKENPTDEPTRPPADGEAMPDAVAPASVTETPADPPPKRVDIRI